MSAIVFDRDTAQLLLALPINRTIGVTIDDRHFTIVDSEFFFDVCRKAGLIITDMNL
jgi:hypothetical protein